MKLLLQSLRLFIWMSILTGLAYPILITVFANLTMNERAQGSFIASNGKIIGSKLIAQKFENEKYFWPRPSAVDYNPLPSGGSNLGSTSEALKKIVLERTERIAKAHSIIDNSLIPSELVYASGSGLDPHISLAAARFQVERIAKSREMNETQKQNLYKLITNIRVRRFLGLIGIRCVNVLELNKSLDELNYHE